MSAGIVRGGMLRLFSGTLAGQVLLSGTNFLVGVLMLRYSGDADYGVYVLATSALLLVTGVQGSLIAAPLSVMSVKKPAAERDAMVSALVWGQYRVWLPLLAVAVAFALSLGDSRFLSVDPLTVFIAAATALAFLARAYLRQVLLIHSAPYRLLAADAVFAAIQIVATVYAALRFDPATPMAVAGLGAAAALSAAVAWRMVRRHYGWSARPYPGALAETWRLGKWGLAGCVITWAHAQGFYYLLAGMEGSAGVATVAAARLLLMPVNLLVTSVGQLLPTVSRWQHEHGSAFLNRRLLAAGGLLLAAAAGYFVVLWFTRAWVVGDILRRDVTMLDPLLLSWGGIFAVMIARSIAMLVLQVQERFEALVRLAVVSTSASLLVAWWGIAHYGAMGSVWGIFVGELIDLVGILWLIRRPRGASEPALPDADR